MKRITGGLSALVVAGVLLTSPAAGQAAETHEAGADAQQRAGATLAPFRKVWVAHTRSAKVRHRRILTEQAYSGCCTLGFRVKYRLSHPRRNDGRLVARAVVRRTRYSNLVPKSQRLHRGDVRRVWIRRHVLHTPHTFYCQSGYPKPICGA